jgi:hypothetical protein
MPKSEPGELLDINRSRCGTPLTVRLADLGDARFVECETCAAKPPFNRRQVFVAFDQRLRGDDARVKRRFDL